MRTELHFENNNLRKIFFKEYSKYVQLDEGYEKRRPFLFFIKNIGWS